MNYLGDFDTTETVRIPFNTFSSDDPSASVTVTNLAAGDVEIYKDGSTTQRASDNGVTVSIDFDGVTGRHMVHIDLSDNSDAGFYAAGSRYTVALDGITVDGATLNPWIGCFSIGCVLRPATNGRTLAVDANGRVDVSLIEGTDATDQINAACDTALTDYDGPTKTEMDALQMHGDSEWATADVSGLALTGEAATAVATLNDITVADIIAGIADGSYDLQKMLRIMFAVIAGKVSGGGTATLSFRDSADSKNRVVATVDADGNRTAVTLNGE